MVLFPGERGGCFNGNPGDPDHHQHGYRPDVRRNDHGWKIYGHAGRGTDQKDSWDDAYDLRHSSSYPDGPDDPSGGSDPGGFKNAGGSL